MNTRKLNNQHLRQFYVKNAEGLRTTKRPNLLSLLMFAIETFYLFSLLLNPSYLSIDTSGNALTYLSIHFLPTTVSEIIVLMVFVIDITIVGLIVYLFVRFCLKPFTSKQNTYLSALIMNYNQIALIPSVMLTTVLMKKDDMTIHISICGITQVWSMIISCVNAFHSTKFYSFYNSKGDAMAKYGSVWDYMKYLLLSAFIIVIEAMGIQVAYTYVVSIYCLINLFDLVLKNTYYSRIINQAFVSQCISLILSSILIEVQYRYQKNAQITAVVIFLCTIIPLSWVFARHAVNLYFSEIDETLQGFLAEAKASRSTITAAATASSRYSSLTSRDRDYYLDVFTRSLLEKSGFFKKEQKVMLSLFELTASFPEEDMNEVAEEVTSTAASSQDHFGAMIEKQAQIARKSLKSKVKQLMDYFNVQEKHLPKIASISSTSMWELFYLLEIEQNLPKLAISVQQFLHIEKASNRSMKELASVSSLQDQLEKLEMNVRNEELKMVANNSSDVALNAYDNDFTTAFGFQEDMTSLEESIMKALKHKLDFSNAISKDMIDLHAIAVQGNALIAEIKMISVSIIHLQLRSINCMQLQQLNRIFVDCLWIDPYDYKLKLFKKFHVNDYNQSVLSRGRMNRQINQNASGQSAQQLVQQAASLHQRNRYRRIDFSDMSSNDFMILTSLSEKSFGKIVKVSNNCIDVTGYTANELINQNCGIIQPSAIAVHHNSILHRGIEQGILRSYSSEHSPIILRHKSGFGIRVSLDLQINVVQQQQSTQSKQSQSNEQLECFTEIGFAARLKVTESDRDNYILIDVSQSRSRVEVVSRNLYEKLLGDYFISVKEINGKELGQMIPIVFNLKEHMLTMKTNKASFQSLFFLPTGQSDQIKRRLSDPTSNLLSNAKKRYYNSLQNDIYLVNFSATAYHRPGEYQLILLELHEFKLLTNELASVATNFFLPHLVEYTGMSLEISTRIVSYILKNSYDDDNEDRCTDAQMMTVHRAEEELSENKFAIIGGESTALSYVKQQGRVSLNNNNNAPIEDSLMQMIEQNQLVSGQISTRILSNGPLSDRISLNESKQLLDSERPSKQPFFIAKSKGSSSTTPQQQKQNHLYATVAVNKIKDDDSPVAAAAAAAEVRVGASDSESCSPNEMYQLPHLYSPSMIHNANKSSTKYRTTTINGKKESNRGSITSQHSSQQSTALRDALFRGISNSQNSSLQLNLMLFIVGSFISIISIVTIVYIEIRNQIATQELSFEFSWFQDKIQDSTISILRLTEAFWLLQYTRQGGNSTEMQAFRDSISTSATTLYAECLTQFKSLAQHDYDDLYLVELLYTKEMQYKRYINTTAYFNKTYSMIHVFQLYSYTASQFAGRQFNQKRLAELEIVYNMDNLSDTIDDVTSMQKVSENALIQDMKTLVLLSLILILSISSFITLFTLPFYWAFQSKKQYILRLFSSISPESITRMYESSANGIRQIHLNRTINNQQNLSNSIHSSNSNSNLDIAKQIVKTRKNLPTTELTKINVQFALQVVFILLVINIQPFVNQLLISAQLSESETELSIVRGLYQLSTSFVYAEYAIFATTEKNSAPPQQSYIAVSVFESKVTESITQVESSIVSLKATINQLYMQSRYNDSEMGRFITNIFTVNACDALANAKTSYFSNNGGLTYNNTLCETLYDGILTQGYFHAMNTFYMLLSQYKEIMESNLDSRTKSTQYTAFYTTNTPLKMEYLFTMIKIAQSAVITCISEEKEQYYATIDFTQLMLFIFEVSFLIVLIPSVIYPFFVRIKQKMVEVVEVIQVLQIQHIQENSYICNFIKQSHLP